MIRVIGLFACWLALVVSAVADPAETLKAGVFDPPRMAPDFTLSGTDGTELTLSRYRGKVVMLGFGFSSCAEVCPTTLARLAAARRKLGDEAADLQVVYVTVDPERDDVARLKLYLSAFDPTFVGGTGTEEQLAAVRRDFGIEARKQTSANGAYLYAHSSFVYLIDRAGRLRALMPYGHPAEDFAHDARLLLATP